MLPRLDPTQVGAREAGTVAFTSGIRRVPLDDPWIVSRILPTPGANHRMLSDWLDGWDLANLRTPIEDN